VTFHDSSASELIVIERLVDRPAGQTVDHWLNEVEEKTVSSPRIREDWMSLHGIIALRGETAMQIQERARTFIS